jgi:hypothetical protein
MGNLDVEIRKLETVRTYLKIQINSSYGTLQSLQPLLDKRNEVTIELKKLHKIKQRKIKIDKILQRKTQGDIIFVNYEK